MAEALMQTTSLVEESSVYGRENDKETIMNLLLSDDASSNKISVITIVGLGGVGKTTLAQLIYNDNQVKEFFELKAWVCVSEEFDLLRVTKTVLEAVTSSTPETDDLNLLQVELKEKLMEKKFLLVLDDVWSENYDDWEILRSPFNFGAHGSKIIVTTRNESVASVMRTVPTYHLEQLSDEDCWLLFAKHAFDNGDSSAWPTHVEVMGREIVKKCKGLPLAAKALGCMFRTEKDPDKWDKIWDVSAVRSNILPVLLLSFNHLPLHLKQCFAYCSIFPNNYEFEREELIRFWMAKDLLNYPKRNKRMEEVGEEYFDDLVSRSFFQQVRDSESRFVMHYLITDLAKYVSEKFSLVPSPTDDHGNDNGAAWQKASWIFVITNFALELLSAVFGQLSSSHKPYFALIAMLISFLAMLVCIVDLIFKGRKERVSWRRRGKICWFYYPHQSHKRFGTFTDIVGLLCAISQFIVSTVQYSYFLRNASNPIKISMWSVVFASGLVCSQLLAKTDTSTPPQQEDP